MQRQPNLLQWSQVNISMQSAEPHCTLILLSTLPGAHASIHPTVLGQTLAGFLWLKEYPEK